jgi:8-oxo-dGTP pyrophosphatase MutT (NUDIX family)
MKASGILFLTQEGRTLFLKRSASGDHPGEWCCAGGKVEEAESLADCAVREAFEETGQVVPLTAIREHTKTFTPFEPTPVVSTSMGAVADPTDREGVEFTTYITDTSEEFIPHLCNEHEAFAWAPISAPPEPLHPGMRIVLRRFYMNELDIAKAIAAGELTSPQKYQNVNLWAMRITGTGESYRDKLEEFVWRDPGIYMTEEMLDRLRAIPIIMEHPQTSSTLNSEEFHDRVVGTMQWPYLVPEAEEVWGITRIYDDATHLLLQQGQDDGQPLSTSPSVTLGLRSGSQKIHFENGSPLLIEGIPTYVDHLAICHKGVWDKGGDPAGVQLNDSVGESDMADFGEKLEKLLKNMDSFADRMDAMEKRMDASREEKKEDAVVPPSPSPTAPDSEEKRDDEDRRKGENDASRDDEHEEKKEEKTVADRRLDDAKKDDTSRRDDDEEKKEDASEEEEKKDDGLKEFAAGMTRKDEAEEKEDSRNDSALQGRVRRLEKAMPRQMTDEDYHAMIEAQSRADSVYGALGIGRAPIPLNGEDLNGYRRRVATKLKNHSSRWGKTNLYNIQSDAFDIVESDIYNDAMASAMSADDVPDGHLRAVVKHDIAGRPITSYVGEPSAWMSQFGGYRRRLTGIRTHRDY